MMNKSESNHFTRSDTDKKKKMDELNTASAFLTKMNDFCAYCNGGHAHHVFICVCKGHISRHCKSKLTCISAIAQTGDNSVAPTKVIVMARWIPIVPVMLALPTLGNPWETMRY